MRPGIRAVVVLAAALAAIPTRGGAQEPVASFDQLNTRIELGDTVWVTDAQGREIRGRIQRLAADALTLEGFGTLDAREVRLGEGVSPLGAVHRDHAEIVLDGGEHVREGHGTVLVPPGTFC